MTQTLAWLALGLVAALLAAAAVVRFSIPGRFTMTQRLLMLFAASLLRFKWKTRYNRPMPRPRDTGAVFIANHRSSIDPIYLQVQADRPMHWMVAKEYCNLPKFRWFLRQCEVIPTNRGGIDTAATKAAIRLASEGGFVGMFPEGRINTTEDFMLPCRPGAILVALKARVPIIPCYIEGSPYDGTASSPLRMRARVEVKFGDPIPLDEYFERRDETDMVREVTLKCLRAIAQLAGRDDFEPTLAGRHWMPAD